LMRDNARSKRCYTKSAVISVIFKFRQMIIIHSKKNFRDHKERGKRLGLNVVGRKM